MTSGAFADLDFTPNRIEHTRRRLAGRYIDLTSSNPTHHGLLFPPDVLRAAAEGFWDTRRYEPDPKGSRRAREAVAGYYAARMAGRAVAPSPDHIFITASTSEAYSLLFALLAEPGDNVLGPRVTYPLFEHLAAIHHVELRPYDLDEARGWAITPRTVTRRADARTRAVLVVSPHNPTGAVARDPLPGGDAPIVCDEVFAEFAFNGPRVPAMFELHDDRPVFVLNGISKMFALPDLKLGWIALNDAALRAYGERLELLNDTFLGANALTQHMLPALFEHGLAFTRAMAGRVRSAMGEALHALARQPRVRVEPPDGGYYLFPAIDGWDDDEDLVVHLLEQGVLVSPGHFFNYDADVRVMLSCLTEPSQLREGIARLVRAL